MRAPGASDAVAGGPREEKTEVAEPAAPVPDKTFSEHHQVLNATHRMNQQHVEAFLAWASVRGIS